MTAPTHITFAEFIFLLILTTTGVALNLWNAMAIGLSSLLADVDTGASRIGRLLPFVSHFIERRFGHRTLTHSLLFVIFYSIALSPLVLINSDIFICLCTGYLTHPLLDTMTVNGVKLFYPLSNHRCVFPFDVNRPGRYRVQTGARMDKALSIAFLIASLPFFYIAHQGYERFIRVAQQSIEAAVRDYNEFSRDHFVMADVDAYDMLTKHRITGSFPVVGALNPSTLVFRTSDGQLHTLGKNFRADYVADAVLCFRGEPASVTTQSVDLSNQIFSQISAFLDTSCENFLFGELAMLERVSIPPNTKAFTPVAASGSIIKLNYATLADMYALGLETKLITRGLVTVRSTRASSSGGQPEPGSPARTRSSDVVQLAFPLEAADSLRFCHTAGDTLCEGDVIALKARIDLSADQLKLNDEKAQSLRRQAAASLADIESKIRIASATLRADSLELASAVQFVRKGFASSESLRKHSGKLQKDRRALDQLLSAKESLRRKTGLELSRLRFSDKQIQGRSVTSQRKAEIRSPIRAILLDHRRILRDSRPVLIVTIKRLD